MRHDSPDGTQAPPPLAAFSDPLAGLITTETPGPGIESESAADYDLKVEVSAPVEPDEDVVQGMVSAALTAIDDGDDDSTGADEGADERKPDDQRLNPTQPVGLGHQAQQPGMLPQQRRTWPTRNRLPRQSARPAGRPLRRPTRAEGQGANVKPSRGSAGVAVAIALLVIFVIIAIQLISSLFDTLSGLF